MRIRNLLTATALLASLTSAADIVGVPLPPLPPFPVVPAVQPVDSVQMPVPWSVEETKLDLPITPGPYAPTWESIEKNYPGTPAWLREAIPEHIKSDQDWIAETPVGDWFYAPGFVTDSGAVIRNLLEEVSRDGNIGVCTCPLPDGSLDDGTVKMLKEIGEWTRINGAGIYGSKAWTRLGEGADGKLNVLPGGKLGRKQADHLFAASDLRFTVGKDGNLYAYCMTVPATGTQVRITSLGTTANALGKPVKSVNLLDYNGTLTWKQKADALVVTLPDTSAFRTALGFKIETK